MLCFSFHASHLSFFIGFQGLVEEMGWQKSHRYAYYRGKYVCLCDWLIDFSIYIIGVVSALNQTPCYGRICGSEWATVAVHTACLNIHQSGVLTATWQVVSTMQNCCHLCVYSVHADAIQCMLQSECVHVCMCVCIYCSFIDNNNNRLCNSYIALNPTWLAQSTSQFKTRMDIRINTWNMHTPDNPPPVAKRRQTCRHPGTISATQATWVILD